MGGFDGAGVGATGQEPPPLSLRIVVTVAVIAGVGYALLAPFFATARAIVSADFWSELFKGMARLLN